MATAPCKVTMDTRPTREIYSRIVAATARQCGLACEVRTGGGIVFDGQVTAAERAECARIALAPIMERSDGR